MKKNLPLILSIIIVLGIILYFTSKQKTETLPQMQTVSTFEECKTAGYPIQETYPERCVTPDGKTFTMDIKNETELTSIKVFFGNSARGAECEKVVSVLHEIPKVVAIGEATVEELLKGPTTLEQSQGFTTALNTDVKINSLSITNGVARIDFDSNLNKSVAGSCRVQAIRAQIEETLKQFPTVQSVIISVNGKTENILEP